MSVNNQMFILFKNLKEGYANDDIDAIEQNARCWMQLAPENPFKYDTPEYEEFFQMQLCYTIWARGDVNSKINRRKMIRHAKALCALNPKQPYVYDKKAEEEEKRKKEEWIKQEQLMKQEALKPKTVKTVTEEEPKVVLGIVPEEEQKKSFLKRIFSFFKEGE